MTDFFLQVGLSNACFSLALAIVAMVVGAKARRPHLAYLLWLLVFVKLLTPPVVTIPVVTIPWQSETSVAINDHSQPGPSVANGRELDVDGQPGAFLSARIGTVLFERGKTGLKLIWLVGSVFVFTWSLVRIFRFNRLLKMQSEVAPQHLQTTAERIASRLGLKAVPAIYTTSANLSPMVWWIGGKVRIIIPTALLDQMETRQFQWIIAHELAHVCRRDYLIRWIEWLACVCFWWNPVTWWARYNLRANEEICCDALVVSSLNSTPNSYANSLLMAIEFLACPALRPPAIASEINSGGFLERRFKMIVKGKLNRNNSRWLQACVLLCAVLVLPFGVAFAHDYDAVGKRLRAAVQAGELTGEQARAMLGVLRKADGAKKETDIDAIGRKIRAAVQAGKMTKEEGRAKMAAIKKGAAKKIDIGEIAKKIRAAVQAGKITKEEGRAKMAGLGQRERGKKTRGEQRTRGERTRTSRDRDPRAVYAAAEKEIKAAIAAGRITEEQGKARLERFRKSLAQGTRGERTRERNPRAMHATAEKRIKDAVAAGRITEKEAKAALEGLKKRMATRGRDTNARNPRARYAAAEKRIKGAIAAGKMTEKEGKATLEGLKKRLAQEARDAWIRENSGDRKAEGARGERTRGR